MNIKTKLSKLGLSIEPLETLIRELAAGYVVGQSELETLNIKFPSTYQSVIQLKSATQSQLAMRALAFSDNYGALLQQILEDYESAVKRGAKI